MCPLSLPLQRAIPRPFARRTLHSPVKAPFLNFTEANPIAQLAAFSVDLHKFVEALQHVKDGQPAVEFSGPAARIGSG